MPRVDILRETAVKRSTRVKQLEGMFDLPPTLKSATRWSVDLPLEQRPWHNWYGVSHGGARLAKTPRLIEVTELAFLPFLKGAK